MKLNARERISKALIALQTREPFLGAILLTQDIQADAPTQTCSVDGKVLRFAPRWVGKLTDAQLLGVMAHEAGHLALGHHVRAATLGKREALPAPLVNRLANLAGDIALNEMLAGDYKLPEQTCRAASFEFPPNECLETYFYLLLQKQTAAKGQPSERQEDAGGRSLATSQAAGTGVGGLDWQKCRNGYLKCRNGYFLPAAGESERHFQEWQGLVARAEMAARQAGKYSAWCEQIVREAFQSLPVDWRLKLRRFANRVVRAGRTYARPNRRSLWRQDIIVPAARSRSLGKIMFASDASGSVSHAEFGMAVHEISAILAAYPQSELWWYQFDTTLTEPQQFGKGRPFTPSRLVRLRCGGTDFRPIVAEAARLRPQALIVLTDGYPCAWPDPIAVPTVWLMTTDIKAPWGETIRILRDAAVANVLS